MANSAALILAAGKGKRMKSDIPKVLHCSMGLSLVDYVLNACDFVKKKACIVSPANQERLASALPQEVSLCIQRNQKGTADAVKAARGFLKKEAIDQVLVVPGDMPLLQNITLKNLFRYHRKHNKKITVLTGVLDNPRGYGRIIRNEKGNIVSIIEEKDLNSSQKNIQEVNTGVYVFETDTLFKCLDKIKAQNAQKEYYLTDAVKVANEVEGEDAVGGISVTSFDECLGVNSQEDLLDVTQVLRYRKIVELMSAGVVIEYPESVSIDSQVKIGKNTVIKPFCVISGDVKIGKDCEVGPFAHIREGVVLADKTCIGNFVEIKKSSMGKGSKAKHLSYLGNATIGRNVNVGAGTITANYDGKHKHPSVIGNGCKLGVNTVIIAPNELGNNVVTGAGSVIPAKKNVPHGSLIYGVPAKVIKRNLTGK